MCVCVCVCVSGPLLRRGRGSRIQQHAFVLFRAFASRGAGPETKKTRVVYSGLFFQRGGICAKGRTSKTNTRRVYPGHCFWAGGGENRNPRSICQGISGAGKRSLEYLHQQMKQRVCYCRADSSRKSIHCSMHAHLITMEFIKGRMV